MFTLLLILAALAVTVLTGASMVGGVPTPQDDSLLMQDTVTKTASFNTAGFDMGSGFAPGGVGMPIAAVIDVSAIDRTTGDETYTFKLQESADNSTFTDCGAACASLTATGILAVSGHLKQRYVRPALTAGGTTPSITYKIWLNTTGQR